MMETASVTMRTKVIITTTAQILFADEKSISGIGESAPNLKGRSLKGLRGIKDLETFIQGGAKGRFLVLGVEKKVEGGS